MKGLAMVAAATLVASCSVAPPLQPAIVDARLTGPFSPGIEVAGTPPPSQWWTLYGSPELDAHVERALSANRDLEVALGNLAAARGAARAANAQRQPEVVIESGAGLIAAERQPGTTTVINTSYDLGGELAWEVDLFGRLKAGALAAQADAEASAAALAGVRVAVIADTVGAYADLCGAVANARVTHALISTQQRSVDVLEKQLATGEISSLEVAQARALLLRTQASLPTFEADRRRALLQLAVLQGKPPSEAETFSRLRCVSAPRMSKPLAIGDGLGLIARRPDVREAERRLAAATARLEVARAAVYPRIRVGTSAGMIGGALQGFVTPVITWAFINPSRVRGQIAQAGGTAEAALANVDMVTLRALREVETTLAELRAERDRVARLSAATDEARAAARRAAARVRIGEAVPTLQLDAERSLADTEQQLAIADLRRARLEVQLMRSVAAGA